MHTFLNKQLKHMSMYEVEIYKEIQRVVAFIYNAIVSFSFDTFIFLDIKTNSRRFYYSIASRKEQK